MKKQLKLSKSSSFGYILILLGLLLLTIPLIRRSYKDYSAIASKKQFDQEQAERKPEEVEKETENAEEYNKTVRNSDITVVDPFTAEDYQTKYAKFTKTNVPFAYLTIPKLDKHLPLYLDATLKHISMGVAQVDGSSIPIGGAGNRSVIAGHRGWWGDTMFLYLDQLQAGDYVYVERAEQTMRYVVHDKEVIGAYDWDKLAPRGNEDILTLMTCEPFLPPRPNRLLVNCYRDEKALTEDFKVPEQNLPVSESEEESNTKESADNTVKITRILTLIFAIIGTVLFVLILLQFIKRIKITIRNQKTAL